MQGEYSGKPIFRHRYVGMKEEAIREEIDRLQEELSVMQDALDYFSKDNKDIKQRIIDNQKNNEQLIKDVSRRIQDLKYGMDYTTPLKKQLDEVVGEFTDSFNKNYDLDKLNQQEKNLAVLVKLTIVNTILIIVAIALVGISFVTL